MRGNIHTTEHCAVCGAIMRHDANRRACVCNEHPEQIASNHFIVAFGRGHWKRFKEYKDAERHLNYLRAQVDHGIFDKRDWQRLSPLGFESLANKWLEQKSKENISFSTLCNLRREIGRAVSYFCQTNIKAIGAGDIEDFIFTDHRTPSGNQIASKTRHAIASTLHQFFCWVGRREKIVVPDFPTVSFELGWRSVVDIDTQLRIIDKIRELCGKTHIKIYLGIKWLSENPNVRPGELVKIKEKQILLDQKLILVRDVKETNLDRSKVVMLEDDDINILRTFPKSFPEVFFFRHGKVSGVSEGRQYSRKMFNRYWMKACSCLGVEGVTLYPGTKHSTVTALGQLLSPEEIKRGGTGHLTNAAFERYLLPNMREKLKVRAAIKKLHGAKQPQNISSNEKIYKIPKS
jgi:integrase